MNLFLHLLVHFALSLLAGLLVWKIYKKALLSFFSAVLAGFLVDMDHFIDYFMAFGMDFRLDYFLSGYQFLKSDKIYILFHGWEYVIILLVITLVFKSDKAKAIFLGLALGLLFHLIADVLIDSMPLRAYSIFYRAKNQFYIEKIVYPEHWQRHLKEKEKVNFL